MSDKVFWVEQRYVVPVVAADLEEAKHVAFSRRTDIARECGSVWDGPHRSGIGLTMRLHDRDGWYGCEPYGRAAGKTVDQWEPEKYGVPAGTIGAQSNPEPPHASATSGDRT